MFTKAFEKVSYISRFKRIGKGGRTVIVGGNSDRQQRILSGLMSHQTGPKFFSKLMGGRKRLAKNLNENMHVGGTILGNRSYIGKDMLKKSKKNSLSSRGVISHEAFHRDVPIVGKSEIMAHFYGGLKNKKNKYDIGKGLEQIKHLYKTRPFVAANEANILMSLGSLGTLHFTKDKARDDRIKKEHEEYVKTHPGIMSKLKDPFKPKNKVDRAYFSSRHALNAVPAQFLLAGINAEYSRSTADDLHLSGHHGASRFIRYSPLVLPAAALANVARTQYQLRKAKKEEE